MNEYITMKTQMPETRISDNALKEKTGKTWKEWYGVISKAGCEHATHKEIVQFLANNHQVTSWWAQMITVGYEQWSGKRDRHQKPDGYEISVSKTFDAKIADLYKAWIDESIRITWLSNSVVIRKANLAKSLRITWSQDSTNVTVNFYSKHEYKTQIVVQHSKLRDGELAEEKKSFWKEALGRLATALQTNL